MLNEGVCSRPSTFKGRMLKGARPSHCWRIGRHPDSCGARRVAGRRELDQLHAGDARRGFHQQSEFMHGDRLCSMEQVSGRYGRVPELYQTATSCRRTRRVEKRRRRVATRTWRSIPTPPPFRARAMAFGRLPERHGRDARTARRLLRFGQSDGRIAAPSSTSVSRQPPAPHSRSPLTTSPHVVPEPRWIADRVFDYRPKDGDEALVVASPRRPARATPGPMPARRWSRIRGTARVPTPTTTARATRTRSRSDGNSYLYTLQRQAGDNVGVGLLASQLERRQPVEPSRRPPADGAGGRRS